jgi:hypothetical protein
MNAHLRESASERFPVSERAMLCPSNPGDDSCHGDLVSDAIEPVDE